jgi:hypothetical protein
VTQTQDKVEVVPSAVEDELRRSWAASTFDAFRFPLYRVVWLGSFFAFMAFNMASTAQGVVAFDITGNNHAVGFVAFVRAWRCSSSTPSAAPSPTASPSASCCS